MDNPFERYDLDPREGIAQITQRLKELAEDAKDDAERERIRAAWEELTLHPARRLRAALFAHPESRKPLGSPPPARRVVGKRGGTELTLRDIAARPSVVAALGGGAERAAQAIGGAGHADDVPPSLDDDPVF